MGATTNTTLIIIPTKGTERTTVTAITPAPTATTTTLATADTQKSMMDVVIIPTKDTIATMSMADTMTSTTGTRTNTSAQRPTKMRQTSPSMMKTPVLPPVRVAGAIDARMAQQQYIFRPCQIIYFDPLKN